MPDTYFELISRFFISPGLELNGIEVISWILLVVYKIPTSMRWKDNLGPILPLLKWMKINLKLR